MARFRSFVPPHLLLRLTGGLVLAAGLLLGGAMPAAAQPEELPLGSPLPSVEAPLVRAEDGAEVPVSDLTGERATVFVFWSNQCPWVDKYEDRIAALGEQVRGEGVSMVLVNANDASSFPRESLEASREKAASAGYDAVYVRDPDAALATALGASRTPHAFVFDEAQTLVYAGAVDDSPADASSVSKPYLQQAIEAVLAGESVPTADTKAFGCMIKYP
jgi:thiol-disulfide isomerase/thioredoxin